MNKNEMAVDVFNRFAEAYQERFMDVSAYHGTLDLFCSLIPNGQPDILELACGPGNITKYLLQVRPDFQVLGTDLAPNMIERARINNPEARFEILDCREMYRLAKKFDGLVCGFVLPYLDKEEAVRLIRDAGKMLYPGGAIYLSTMEDDYSKSGLETSSSGNTVYMHYHEAGYLEDALTASGFTIRDIRRQDFNKPDGTRMTDLIVVAVKS